MMNEMKIPLPPETRTVSNWLALLDGLRGELPPALRGIWGEGREHIRRRCVLVRSALTKFLEAFGDEPVRIFRSPGRINLRGMHVDTHGGYLNLMTHQREVVAVAMAAPGTVCRFRNIDDAFAPVEFDIGEESGAAALQRTWMDFIQAPDTVARVDADRGGWGQYLKGAVLRARHAFPEKAPRGMQVVIGSDLPRGAALSSSHALCVVTLSAALAINNLSLDNDALILAVRDAEWYTGARSGVSDQSAEILGGMNQIVNVALFAEDFDSSGARRLTLPEDLDVLVVNSFTERSLSGAQKVAYTRNRFAYSMAMEILRHELRAGGMAPEKAARLDRLSRMTPEALGGNAAVYAVLRRVPVEMPVTEMRPRYALPYFEEACEKYFGGVPDAVRPDTIGLRGPLLFGLAESERARQFLPALASGDTERAGMLMNRGHDGDRLRDPEGRPFHADISDAALEKLAASDVPVEMCPGVYGASSPVLDRLVDTARQAGAAGACLTGAGIAGAVLALCRKEDTEKVRSALFNLLASRDYAELTGREAPLAEEPLEDAVLINQAPAGAGELIL
jgi:galactokinase